MIYIDSGYTGETYGMDHPRVLWNSVTRRGSVVASSEADGYEAVNALTPFEHDAWKPTALAATWDLTFDGAETVSAVAIGGHTIGSTGTQVQIMEDDGVGGWVNIMAQQSPDDDEPIAFLFAARTIDKIRIRLVGTTEPELSVIHVCEALELPSKVYGGVSSPIDMALNTAFSNTRTARGKYVGRSLLYERNTNSFPVSHLEEAWVRSSLMPFVKDAREYPYFLLERPASIPAALSYRWSEADIRPERMGQADLMQVQL